MNNIPTTFNNEAIRRLKTDSNQYLQDLGLDTEETTYVVKQNTRQTFYVAIPFTNKIADEDMSQINAAGNTAGTVASVSTVGSAGSVCTTFSTAGSGACVGSVSSA